MATKRFEEEAQRIGGLIARRHLAWMYIFITVLLGIFAFFLWDSSFRWPSVVSGLIAAASLTWALFSGFRVRLRKLRCPCCDGEVEFRNIRCGAQHMICKRCGQTSHLGLRDGNYAA
jgi:hypothetical protein